jgi:hypothetical protein
MRAALHLGATKRTIESAAVGEKATLMESKFGGCIIWRCRDRLEEQYTYSAPLPLVIRDP